MVQFVRKPLTSWPGDAVLATACTVCCGDSKILMLDQIVRAETGSSVLFCTGKFQKHCAQWMERSISQLFRSSFQMYRISHVGPVL
jgi:hypothetical protein